MGKHLKIICLFFFFCITTYISSFPVYAESSFDTSEIQISDLPDSFVNSISISDEEITGKSIRSFDVSSDNNIIISLSNGDVNVYDESLAFKYSIRYEFNGSSLAFWLEGLPAIYLDKCDKIAMISSESSIICAFNISNTIDDSRYYRYLIDSKKETVNYEYYLTFSSDNQKYFSPNFTKLIRVNKITGKKEIIYENLDANSNILGSILLILLFLFAIIFIAKKCIMNSRKSNYNSDSFTYL